ncbi:MAG: guanosine monophosphate reductase [Candidatus Nanohaloarchaea archaeon]
MEKGISYDDILIKPQKTSVTSLENVDTSTEIAGLKLEVPIISAAMDTVTEKRFAEEIAKLGGLGCIHRFMPIEEQASQVEEVKKKDLKVSAAIGLKDRERAKALLDAEVDALVIDIAHGHHESLLEELEYYSETEATVIAGNIGTAAGAKDLEEAGADAVKVGIGPGSSCITREMTGAGVPQFTAVKNCAEAVDIPIIADGGIRKPGDLVKAVAAGASAGQIGGMFAGTKETPGEIMEIEGEKYKVYRGMASKEAAEKRAEREKRDEKYSDRVPEGVETKVKYKGHLKNIISNLEGGLRSGISYCGADNVKEAQKKAEFIEISESTQSRNSHHAESL